MIGPHITLELGGVQGNHEFVFGFVLEVLPLSKRRGGRVVQNTLVVCQVDMRLVGV